MKFYVTPHILRHTFITELYYAGVDLKTAQYLAGHSDIKTTLKIYTHLDNEKLKSTSDKMKSYYNKLKLTIFY
jgi:site-specific recombinase XerD